MRHPVIALVPLVVLVAFAAHISSAPRTAGAQAPPAVAVASARFAAAPQAATSEAEGFLEWLAGQQEPVPPRQRCTCNTALLGHTPTYTGSGSSCAAANQSVSDQAFQYEVDFCDGPGVCYNTAVIVTAACTYNSQTRTYRESGFERFKCNICP
jgi:hypothetical protein